MSDDSGRISVSKDFLTGELRGLELRLVEKLATKTDHEGLTGRVSTVEETMARIKGGLILLSVVVGALATYAATHI